MRMAKTYRNPCSDHAAIYLFLRCCTLLSRNSHLVSTTRSLTNIYLPTSHARSHANLKTRDQRTWITTWICHLCHSPTHDMPQWFTHLTNCTEAIFQNPLLHTSSVEFYKHQTFQPDLWDFEPRLYPPPHAWHPLAAGQPRVHEAIAWLRCLQLRRKRSKLFFMDEFSFSGDGMLALEMAGVLETCIAKTHNCVICGVWYECVIWTMIS